jgi:hypothetical protein
MDTPHPQDAEFAEFSTALPDMSDRKLIMTILGMLTMDGSPHPNRWSAAMNAEATARADGKRCPESVRQCEESQRLSAVLSKWKSSPVMRELGETL